MATREKKAAIDIDDILLREVASRRSVSGSILDMTPEAVPPVSIPEEEPVPEPVREEVPPARAVRSRHQGASPSPYEEIFLRRGVVSERSAVYVSAETKRRLTEVVRRLGWSSISVTTYVENILTHHLELFRGEINRLYRQKNNKDLL